MISGPQKTARHYAISGKLNGDEIVLPQHRREIQTGRVNGNKHHRTDR